jgi:glyoxylate/hydroxypyruvate reductase A
MVTVVIATPVEPELVERLRAVDERLEVLFEPELLPPPRYPCDHAGDPSFERTPEQEARFTQLVARAEVLFGYPREDPAQIAWAVRTAAGLRFVQATFAGAGQQLAAAQLPREDLERISWTSSAGVHATPLAEWSLFGILALTKGLPRLQADKAARHWDHYPVDEARGTTVLVAGLGEIGREVARLAEALGMRVLSLTRTAGHLRGAALDVFAQEPLPPESPLWELDNVILSPHTAALSRRENERVVELFADNLRRYLDGRELRSRIRTDLFY